jgi:hypothetical protein
VYAKWSNHLRLPEKKGRRIARFTCSFPKEFTKMMVVRKSLKEIKTPRKRTKKEMGWLDRKREDEFRDKCKARNIAFNRDKFT